MHFDIDYHTLAIRDEAPYKLAASRAGIQLTVKWPKTAFDPSADWHAFFQTVPVPPIKVRRSVLYETGFFSGAAHFDTRGLWADSSFHTQATIDRIRAYKAPGRAQDVVAHSGLCESKYEQPNEVGRWNGVVLAAQVSLDHSVSTIPGGFHKRDAFWAFVEGACKYYGKRLFIKLHPRNQGPDTVNYTTLAGKYGCKWGNVGLSILDHCRFVLLYNSGFAVDCWLRGIPVAQFAPGYFSDTGAVTYTKGVYPDACNDTSEMAQRMLDWLIWKYCYYQHMPPAAFISLLESFAKAPEGETFPLPEELSYAAQCGQKAKGA